MARWLSAVVVVLCVAALVCEAAAGLTGTWQGATATGRPIVLDAKVDGKRLTGTLKVGDEIATITEGKTDEKTFTFTISIEGRTVACNGRLIDESVELNVQDVPNRLILKRVK